MKIISDKEFSKIKLKFIGGGKTPFRNPLMYKLNGEEFKVGTHLLVYKNEYDKKTYIGGLIFQSFRIGRSNKKFSTRKLADESGWIITRIK